MFKKHSFLYCFEHQGRPGGDPRSQKSLGRPLGMSFWHHRKALRRSQTALGPRPGPKEPPRPTHRPARSCPRAPGTHGGAQNATKTNGFLMILKSPRELCGAAHGAPEGLREPPKDQPGCPSGPARTTRAPRGTPENVPRTLREPPEDLLSIPKSPKSDF